MSITKLPLNEIELHALNVCLNWAGNAQAWADAFEGDPRLPEALLRVARKIETADMTPMERKKR